MRQLASSSFGLISCWWVQCRILTCQEGDCALLDRLIGVHHLVHQLLQGDLGVTFSEQAVYLETARSRK
eukprot:5275363-Amphidinium_carterae.1